MALLTDLEMPLLTDLGANVIATGHGCEDAFATLSTDDVDVLIIYADTYENPIRGSLVSFQWKNVDFLLNNLDFLLNNVDFIMKQSAEQWQGLFGFIEGGGGLFALHTASAYVCLLDAVCFVYTCRRLIDLSLIAGAGCIGVTRPSAPTVTPIVGATRLFSVRARTSSIPKSSTASLLAQWPFGSVSMERILICY